MKVTAIIPDDLMPEVRTFSSGKTTTESLISALREWTAIQKIKTLSATVRKTPLSFITGFSAESARKVLRT